MPRRLARKLILSITVIVLIVAAVSGLVNVTTEEKQLLNTVLLGADQLSKGITSATWHAMLDDHREAAYQVMQTIALKQGIDRIRMFNSAGHITFSTNPDDRQESMDLRKLDAKTRVNIYRGADGWRRLDMRTPIYNETLVQPGGMPRASGRRQNAGRARPVAEPRRAWITRSPA